jgi:uncharacterized protein (UPF0335 family)
MAGRKPKEPTIGDNLPIDTKLLQEHVVYIAKKMDEQDQISGKMKDRLRAAKDDGFSKMAIRKAAKLLRMTEEQRQAKKEVETQTEYYTDLCADLPLFANRREEDEEAA